MIKKEIYETITPENGALVVVDHQIGLYTGVKDISILELKHNIVVLVKACQIFGIPIIVNTTTVNVWGPTILELKTILKDISIIQRTTVNALHDQRVYDAIKKTNRKKLIMT